MQNEVLYDEVFDAQQHFRLIMDSMSRPGKLNIIPAMDLNVPEGINNASILVGFSLLNTDVSFCTINKTEDIGECISVHTSAKIIASEKADFVFVSGTNESDFISDLKYGSLSYPEDSATLIIDANEVSHENISGALQLTLKGPGIQNTETVYVAGINQEILDAVKSLNTEFPLGIDLIITDRNNKILCIPRSNDFSYFALI